MFREGQDIFDLLRQGAFQCPTIGFGVYTIILRSRNSPLIEYSHLERTYLNHCNIFCRVYSTPGELDDDSGIDRGWVYVVDTQTLDWRGWVTSVVIMVTSGETRVSQQDGDDDSNGYDVGDSSRTLGR